MTLHLLIFPELIVSVGVVLIAFVIFFNDIFLSYHDVAQNCAFHFVTRVRWLMVLNDAIELKFEHVNT